MSSQHLCPICQRIDMVQKVSSVVSSSSGGGGGIYRTSTDLAGKLNHPPDPHTTRTDAFDNLFLGCGCGTVIFFGIIWFIGAGIALGIAHLRACLEIRGCCPGAGWSSAPLPGWAAIGA
jgi:hypothetical protein